MPDLSNAAQTIVTKRLSPRIAGAELVRYFTDRAARLARTAAALRTRVAPQADELILNIATLYAALPLGKSTPALPTAAATRQDIPELAAEQLAKILPPAQLDLLTRTLLESTRRTTQLPEAQLLADALALDDIGLVGLWNQTRYFHEHHRSLEQFIRNWHTQRNYNYWDSRLTDGFFFPLSREWARQRLEALPAFFAALEQQQNAADIPPLSAASPGPLPAAPPTTPDAP